MQCKTFFDHFPSQCLCGAKDCRGEIGDWQNLPHNKREQYQGFVAPYLLELDTKFHFEDLFDGGLENH